MSSSFPLSSKHISRWLSAAALALTGFVGLAACIQPTPPSSQLSPLSPLSAPVSPLATKSPTLPAPPNALQLTVIHTNDTWGYLAPCG